MKLLFDQNLSFRLCHSLADLFPDSSQVRLLGLSGASDRELWDYAKEHDFVLVSFDVDFAEMSTLQGHPPKVIWLRCGNQPTSFIEALLRRNAEPIANFARDSSVGCLEIY